MRSHGGLGSIGKIILHSECFLKRNGEAFGAKLSFEFVCSYYIFCCTLCVIKSILLLYDSFKTTS